MIARQRAALVDFLQDYARAIRWSTSPANRAQALDMISRFTKQPASVFDGWVLVPGKTATAIGTEWPISNGDRQDPRRA